MGLLKIMIFNFVVKSDNELYVHFTRKNVLVNLPQTFMSDGAWFLMRKEVIS